MDPQIFFGTHGFFPTSQQKTGRWVPRIFFRSSMDPPRMFSWILQHLQDLSIQRQGLQLEKEPQDLLRPEVVKIKQPKCVCV